MPAFCHKRTANRPLAAAARAATGVLMESSPPTRKLMKLDTDPRDANAELHGFEPLRITLALGALLLGLLLGI
jgi:hypothetical protein